MDRLHRWTWRRGLPPAWGWLRILASPASYILTAALLLIVVAKCRTLWALDDAGTRPVLLMWAISPDVAFHAGLIALLSLGEGRAPLLRAATIPIALGVLLAAVCNAAYLSIAGEQLTWEAVVYGLDSWTELRGIVLEHLRATGVVGGLVHTALAITVPVAAGVLLRRHAPVDHVSAAHARAHVAGAAAALALLVWLLAPRPSALPVRQLGGNATLATYWGWVTGEDPAADRAGDVEFRGFRPPALVEPDAIAAIAAGPRPNVIVVILESTRRDVTSLAGGPAATPALAALAARGTDVPVTRAAVPHTTKSVFSMLCGRLPLMQRVPVEVAATIEVQCAPAVLAAAGYRTGFFQSALGTFEHRPRLVDKLGFEHYEAWEDIGGEPLGYLASDDETLAAALARWLDAGEGPFFAVLLTSAPHHPYRLSATARDHAEDAGLPTGSDFERYLRLIEAEDRMLADVLADLRTRDALDDTIVIVAGDHGEGFGAKGVRQHDNNFFEEGLRVPLVLAGPGVPAGATVAGNASLVDLAPTLYGLLGAEVSTRARARPGAVLGHDLLAGPLPEAPRWFGCYYEGRCRGYVRGDHKVVFVPQRGQAFYFDLAADPDETRALPLTDAQRASLPRLHRVVESRITRRWPLDLAPVRLYGQWTCPAGQRCSHPRSPAGFFENP